MSHAFDDVLAIAAYHVRRTAARVAYAQPWRLGEVLRCRQWAAAPFTFRHLQATEPVTSAYAFLVSRLQQVVFERSKPNEACADNARALRSLQSALLAPASGSHRDLVPTAWLLALGELLDFEHSRDWRTHAAGTTALLKAGLVNGGSASNNSMARLMPTLFDAFLNHEDAAVSNEPWQAVIRPLINERLSDGALANFVASRLMTAAALIAEGNVLKVATRLGSPHWTLQLSLLERTAKARNLLKEAILELQSQSKTDTNDVGLCLAALIGLDRTITALRPTEGEIGKDHEGDTLEFCMQILQDELKRGDACPSGPLLLAFERHGNLGALLPVTMELSISPR